MTPQNIAPHCPHCGGTMIKKSNDKGEFWACPNWKPNNMGCKGSFMPLESPAQPIEPEIPTISQNTPVGTKIPQTATPIIIDKINSIIEQLNELVDILSR